MANKSKFAVVKINNAQYKVYEGENINIQKILGEPNDKLTYEDVLLFVEGDKIEVGKPTVSGKKVEAEIVEQTKDVKIRMLTYKSKSRYRKRKGHRQQLTTIKINKII
jgi:large subunit ribosomal protein L21